MRYALEIAYKGEAFHGWQKQDNAGSVQQTLENSIYPLVNGAVHVHGCGRTDTGVHARNYIAHFDGEIIKPENFIYSLNQILPADISVDKLYQVSDEFHSRFDAKSRTYKYFLHQKKNPFSQRLSWYFQRGLNIAAMNEACEALKEFSDFASFCKSKSDTKTTLCRLDHAQWSDDGKGQLTFEITADRFLRNMVRAIVGTLLEVGISKMNLKQLKDVVEARDRREAGFSVPAHGLHLWEIEYDRSDWKEIKQGRAEDKGIGKEG